MTPAERESAMKEWPLLGIRERRMAAGMSLRELAAAVGISSVEMGEYERGVRLPTMSTAAAISRAISAASPSGTMSERDVPAERDERDELRRNFAAWLDEWRFCPACDVQLQRSTGTEFVPTGHRHEDDCVLAGILALLAGLGAPAPAEATEPPCYCTPGVYTPSADCPRHMRPAEATERSES